jgi:integrase
MGLAMNAAPPKRRETLTDKQLASKKRRAERYIEVDPEQRGLYLRVPPEGPIVFAAVARDPYGKQIWATLDTTADLKVGDARQRAREAIRRIKDGEKAIEPPKPKPESVAEVAENWLRRHVEKNNHRTAAEMRRQVDKYILPYWRDRIFVEIKRADVTALLDMVEDKHGPAMADAILTTLRSIAGWVQKRNDDYVPPFVRGMKRVPKEVHNRSRKLDDFELRQVWNAAGEMGQFGAFVRLLLLSAQRRDKVANLRWDDIDAKGVWTIRTEKREKGNPGKLQLPKAALDIIEAQPRFVGNPYVFAGKDGHALRRNSDSKIKFDAKCGIKDWRLHDLRRTARSLMSRAGVQSEHAERVLGHAIGGVEGIYDRHDYDAEKADALRKLAALVERIVSPPAENVVALEHARA